MGQRAYLEILEKRKTLFPLPEFELSIKLVILLIRNGCFISEYMSHASILCLGFRPIRRLQSKWFPSTTIQVPAAVITVTHISRIFLYIPSSQLTRLLLWKLIARLQKGKVHIIFNLKMRIRIKKVIINSWSNLRVLQYQSLVTAFDSASKQRRKQRRPVMFLAVSLLVQVIWNHPRFARNLSLFIF